MATTVFLVCAAICLQTSLALICKNCNIADCDQPQDEECLIPGESQSVSCLTEIFKDSEERVLFQKKCVIYDRDAEFECAPYPNYHSLNCMVCNADFCNKEPTPASISAKNFTIGGVNHRFNRTNSTL